MLVALLLEGAAAAADRAPVAWALRVEGRVMRNEGSFLDAGEAIEPWAHLTLPTGAVVTAAHNGRIVRWEGPGTVRVTPMAVRSDLSGQDVRWPHAEGGPTLLAGDTQAPAGVAQWTSAVGIPLDSRAWARQDAIDGGNLHALYRDVLSGRLAAAGIERALVEKMGLADALPGDRSEQIALVGGYLDLAGATSGSTLLLEVPPTFTPDLATGSRGGAVLRGLFTKPKTFRADGEIDQVRAYGLAIADALRRRGSSVFALVVPYANTVENILARHAGAADGVENLHHLLVRAGGLDGAVRTLAFGYEQGASVVREYVARYGDSDGLDYALPIGALGGADGEGADGVWSGRVGRLRADGVTVLSAVNARDPARRVHGRSAVAMTPGLLNFPREGGPQQTHAPRDALYPLPLLAPMIDDLLIGRPQDEWGRRGDWGMGSAEPPNGDRVGDLTQMKIGGSP